MPLTDAESVFYLTLVSVLSAFTITLVKICFSSRCDVVQLPFITIHRNVNLENEEQMQANIINRNNVENV
jgi:hypothetical protein